MTIRSEETASGSDPNAPMAVLDATDSSLIFSNLDLTGVSPCAVAGAGIAEVEPVVMLDPLDFSSSLAVLPVLGVS